MTELRRMKSGRCRLRQVPVEDLRAVPADDSRPRQELAHMRSMYRMRCGEPDRYGWCAIDMIFGALRRFLVQALEEVHRPEIHLLGAMVLKRHRRRCRASSKLYGSATIGLCVVLSVTGSSSQAQSPMYSMPASERWSTVSKVCVRPGPNQPRGRLPENRSIMSRALAITRALVVDLVHRLLVVAVGVQLPAAVDARLDRRGIGLAAPGIERHRRTDAEPVEHADGAARIRPASRIRASSSSDGPAAGADPAAA